MPYQLKNLLAKITKVFKEVDGAEFYNIQYVGDKPYLILFNCSAIPSTLSVKVENLSIENVKEKIRLHIKNWK